MPSRLRRPNFAAPPGSGLRRECCFVPGAPRRRVASRATVRARRPAGRAGRPCEGWAPEGRGLTPAVKTVPCAAVGVSKLNRVPASERIVVSYIGPGFGCQGFSRWSRSGGPTTRAVHRWRFPPSGRELGQSPSFALAAVRRQFRSAVRQPTLKTAGCRGGGCRSDRWRPVRTAKAGTSLSGRYPPAAVGLTGRSPGVPRVPCRCPPRRAR